MNHLYRIRALIAVPLFLLAGPVMAQIDPDPDGIGIYADLDAAQPGIQVPLFTEFDAYLIATNISEDDILSWALRLYPSSGLYFAAYPVPYECSVLNVHTHGTDLNIICSNTLNGEDSIPLGTGPQVHLMTLSMVVVEPGPHGLYIEPYDYSPFTEPYPEYSSVRTIANGLPWIELNPSSGSCELPVFVVNGDEPIANEEMSFGKVKRLYR